MKIADAIKSIETLIPPIYGLEYVTRYQSFDNSGFLIGDMADEFTSCVLCLDVTSEVIEIAKSRGANLILSHHPIIYSPLQSVTADTAMGKLVMELIENKISVYSAHLSLDIMHGGINDILCDRLGILNPKPMFDVLDAGLGRIGMLSPILFQDFLQSVKDKTADDTIWAVGATNEEISCVAILGGGGGSDIENIIRASKLGADVYISADFKHHVIMLAKEIGLKLISLSHYEMERVVLEFLKEKLIGIDCYLVCSNIYC